MHVLVSVHNDLTIQPIEEVMVEQEDTMSLHTKGLNREDLWMRELKTIQPYGLNDNVCSVGNISKLPVEPVVWSFFRRRSRTRKHKPERHPRSHKRDYVNPHHRLLEQVGNYKSVCFLKTYITSLFSCKTSFIKQIRSIANDLLPLNQFPQHLLVTARDIAVTQVQRKVESPSKHFLNVTFHNKDMIKLH